MFMKIPSSYDIIGSIAILKFPSGIKQKEKKKTALELLKHKNIKTVLEKIEKVKGRLRTYKTRYLTGVKTKETIHNESGCRFKLDVEKCYFSPRLSNERIEIAKKVNKKDRVLVMFAGVAPFSCIIAKKAGKVVSVELSILASKYALENVKLNKLGNVEIIQGNVKKIIPGLARRKIKFDKIIMPRPQLKESFLDLAFKVSKKSSRIFYYDFGNEVGKILERIYKESKKAKRKIVIEKVKKAGEIAPYKFRWRVEFKVL